MNYLSSQYLLDPAGPAFHYVWPAVIFFPLCAMLASSYAYFVGELNNKRAPITRMAGRVQGIAWTVAIIGVLLIGFRVGDAQIPLIGSRLVLYLVALCFLGLVLYVGWWLRYELPRRNAAYEATRLKRQYLPRSKRRR